MSIIDSRVGGLVSTADTTGTLQIQTNSVDAVSIDTSQKVILSLDPTVNMQAVTKQYCDKGASMPSGTRLLFQQSSAPTGWTKDTTHDNKALRVVSGAVTVGGTVPFTTAFSSKAVNGTISGTVANHTLSVSQVPRHGHNTLNITAFDYAWEGDGERGFSYYNPPGGDWHLDLAIGRRGVGSDPTIYDLASSFSGEDGSHAHGFSGSFNGSAIDMAVQYVDVIIATKD